MDSAGGTRDYGLVAGNMMEKSNHNALSRRVLLARFDDATIRVYQAYCPAIANEAVHWARSAPISA